MTTDIVVLGLLFSEESLEFAYKDSKVGVQVAPHMFQKKMLEGIKNVSNVNVTLVNIPPVGSYPLKYKKMFLKDRIWEMNNIEVGYINIPFIKHLQQEKKIYSILADKVKRDKKKILHILIYSSYEPFLRAAIKIKERYKNVKICLLQTDAVPGINDMDRYMTFRNKIRGKKIIQLAKKIDSFVVLTKNLVEALEIGERPYSIVECICDPSQESLRKDKSENICLYTGTTMEEYNIKDIVDSFKLINNAQLWICGFGNMDNYIKDISNEYPNIRHFGMLKPDEVQILRDKCDFLINPRRPTGTYTKYSFPSKIAEYLMSGKPTILYKLEGIPDEYDEFLNYITGTTPEKIAIELNKIFSLNYSLLTKKAKKARIFVVENKNSFIQGKKIVETLKS
ncbi:glycosyltransferase [uncultured Fusobacterium sp.]|uniref:glycosyltransferase n=1 Tax=uncultured Fusobacterium sp. TaxID=159267 RepID=UPI0025D4FF25|nr:glycosyltransferase [uncultured Fusobacterium sp.]